MLSFEESLYSLLQFLMSEISGSARTNTVSTATLVLKHDYQFIANPGYNADRGPANVFAARAHWQFAPVNQLILGVNSALGPRQS